MNNFEYIDKQNERCTLSDEKIDPTRKQSILSMCVCVKYVCQLEIEWTSFQWIGWWKTDVHVGNGNRWKKIATNIRLYCWTEMNI